MKIFKILTLILSTICIETFAQPVKYDQCDIQIKHTQNSNGVLFSEDCKTVYVLPPSVGRLSLSGFQPTGFLSDSCKGLQTVEITQNELLNVSQITARRIRSHSEELEKIEQNLRDGLLPRGTSVADAEDRLMELIERISTLRHKQMEWTNQYREMKSHYAQSEGGRSRFLLETNYEKLIQDFRELNPEVQFAKLPLDQSFISVVDQPGDDLEMIKVQMPAVLSLQIPGLSQMPLNSELQVIDVSKADIFGDAISGELRLSHLGACPMLSAGKNTDLSNLSQYLAANSTYQYQVQVERNHSITFNLKELIHQIHKQTSKSGFFTRKTLNSLVDNRSTNSWIEFHVSSNDQRFQYSDEYIQDVKKEFISRALAQVMAIQTGNPMAHLSLIDARGKSGADVIGEELGKCFHLYCQIGASGFRILSSIFSGSEAVGQLSKRFQGRVTETVREKRMVTQIGTVTFL